MESDRNPENLYFPIVNVHQDYMYQNLTFSVQKTLNWPISQILSLKYGRILESNYKLHQNIVAYMVLVLS